MPYAAASAARPSSPLAPMTTATQLPPIFAAASLPAAKATSVVFGNFPCTCSAKTRTSPMAVLLDHFRFGMQKMDELLDRADLLAGLTFRGRLHLHDLRLGRDVDAEAADLDL